METENDTVDEEMASDRTDEATGSEVGAEVKGNDLDSGGAGKANGGSCIEASARGHGTAETASCAWTLRIEAPFWRATGSANGRAWPPNDPRTGEKPSAARCPLRLLNLVGSSCAAGLWAARCGLGLGGPQDEAPALA